MRPELRRQVAAQRVLRLERHLQAAEVVAARWVAVAAEDEDHPGALAHHLARAGLRRDEHRPDRRHDRLLEVRQRHLDQRRALYVAVRDQVERDVEAAEVVRHCLDVRLDRVGVECVDDRGLCRAAGCADPLGGRFEPLERPPDQMHTRALARERLGDGGPDRSPAAVDDGIPTIEQHGSACLSVRVEAEELQGRLRLGLLRAEQVDAAR